MAFGAVKILDINGLSYLYTKLNNNITDFQNTSKAIIDSAAAAANSAADRANAISGNIDNTYATKEELATAIGEITSFEFLVVTVLPSEGTKGTIYLMEHALGNQSTSENTYDEYIWVGSKYEKIGTTDINFSKYSTSEEIANKYLTKTDAATTYATQGEVSTLDTKVDNNTTDITTHTRDTDIHITAEERTDWNAAKTHADSEHARTDATKVEGSTTNGNIKINGVETMVYTHPSGTNPHGTTKSDIGLGNVGNYKAVSTVASQNLDDDEKANARANIGAQVAGSYAPLSHTSDATAHITTDERINWNAAKVHADSAHARVDATKVEGSTTNGNIKINGTETTVYTHPSGTNPHGTTKSDVGLGNVGNFKAVSTVASQGLNDTEKANARANINAQVAGSYAPLSHTSDTTVHITANERTAWNQKTTVAASTTNGNIKINGTETTVYTHPSGTNPHGTTKSDVGLGNVGNFKAVSTVASQGLNDTEKANARANIGAGDGNYNNLSNRPTIGNGTITIKQNGTSKGTFTMNQTGNTTIELSDTNSASGVGAIPSSQKGSANGVASLDANGKVPSSQLPSYVDDVVEGYLYNGNFYKESAHTTKISGEASKIYINISDNKTYRWSGSAYAVISETLALGETSSTAYAGDKGATLASTVSSHTGNSTIHITANERTNWNVAKTHADSTHARTDATKVEKSSTNGNIKINGTETTVYTHPSGTNPHGTTKADVGLGSVGNFKAVSTVASQGLTAIEKANARANIGAGTSSLTIGTGASNAAAGNHTHNYAGSGSAGGSATSAVKLDTATAGSATQPVYFTGGKPTACTYTLGKSVPSNAVFTDTDVRNTAGSTDTSSKIFLVGATSQAANPQTYSDNQVYVQNGQLNGNTVRVAEKITLQYNSSTQSLDLVFA